jgi:hypothetical protein
MASMRRRNLIVVFMAIEPARTPSTPRSSPRAEPQATDGHVIVFHASGRGGEAAASPSSSSFPPAVDRHPTR